MTNGEIVFKGTAGTAAGLGAFFMSPAFEHTLRVASLSVGIAVGLVTLWTLLRKNQTSKNEKNSRRS